MAYSPDQRLVSNIVRLAQPRDRAITLATSLVESGGQLGAVGDNGQSFGPFQEYTGGRGAGLTPAQREDPAGATQRFLKELGAFRARGFTGGELAFRTQRPADHAGYVQKINAALPIAKQILAGAGGGNFVTPASNSAPAAGGFTAAGVPSLTPKTQKALANYIIQSRADVLAGRTPRDPMQVLGFLVNESKAPTLGGGGLAATPRVRANQGYVGGVVGGGAAKIIGTPYSGTHTLGNWESDNAIDVAIPTGTPLYAPADGVIGPQFGSLGAGGRFAGLRLHLQVPGNELYYAHLERFAPGIQPGMRVRKGQVIGYSGSANGVAHLHLGVRNGDPRRYAR